MNKKFTLLIFTLSCNFIFSQNLLKNYKGSTGKIQFTYELKAVNYNSLKNQGVTTIEFKNYLNESKPGEYILPQREIYISLPAYSKVDIQVIPKKVRRIKGIPSVNPVITLESDSCLQYQFNSKENLDRQYSIKPLVEIKGYLWIRNFYCVRILINQYRFNNVDIIEELNEAEFKLSILNPGKNKIKATTTEMNTFANIFVNKNYAVELDRKFYEEEQNSEYDWINFNTTYLKLGVTADGIYRITKQDLLNQNISITAIDPRNFNLFLKGKTVPIYVKGEADGIFDDKDFIEFFGRRNWGDDYRKISTGNEQYKNYLDRYSDTTIYWLTWDKSLQPNRIAEMRNFSQIPADTVKFYSEVVHYEQDHWLDYSIPSLVDRQNPEWLTNETWVWGQQGVGTANRAFTVSDVYPNSTAKAFYKIQSFASNGFINAHKIGLSVNNDPAVYDSSSFNKYSQRILKAVFSSNLLNEGNNVLKTISFPTNTNINSVEYDWYEVEYPRYLKAINDSLKFKINDNSSTGIKSFKVTNVNSGNIILYKFSGELKRLTNFSISQNVVTFTDSVKQGDNYYLITEDKIGSPKYFYKKQFRNLADNNIQAEYILITHPKFISKSTEYLSFINSTYGVNTKLINIFDIYDQFNYGFFSPEPIKNFLHTAYLNWQNPKPTYVFLVGDATYDYYDDKTKYFSAPEQINYVPTFGHPVSDTWFTVWDSTGAMIPQMNISRLPINTIEEYDRYFNVHKDYAVKPFNEFNKKYLLFSSGESNNSFELSTLKSTNDYIDTAIVSPAPTGGIVRHLYKMTNPLRNFGPFTGGQVEKYIGDGGVFISYIGHSGVQIWDNGISSPVQLKNKNGNHSLISDWGCSTGKFAEPDIKAFSELFITGSDGGAIAYNGNSSLGFISTATTFPKIFYSKILNDGITGIAEAHTVSKIKLLQQYGDSNVNKIFVLCNTFFGDPIVSLKVPQKPNLKILPGDISILEKNIDDRVPFLTAKIYIHNLGRVDSLQSKFVLAETYEGKQLMTLISRPWIPLNKDSVEFTFQILGRPGKHNISVSLDYDYEIDELDENDNFASIDINVPSASTRTLLPAGNFNQVDGTIRFLNPAKESFSNILDLELADNIDFNDSKTVTVPFDTFYTDVNIKQYFNNKRIWLRSKVSGSNNWGSVRSFIAGNKNNFLFSDSLSYDNSLLNNLKFMNKTLQLDSSIVSFKIISGGLNDGNAIVIQKDNQDYVTSNTERGHFVVLFKNDDLSFVKDYRFDIFGNAGSVNDYINLLDTLDNSYLVLFGIKDEGSQNLSKALKNKIKEFGSIYIDKLGFRNSWAMIGRRGAAPGSVPESFKKTFEGRAIVDTSINIRFNSGTIETEELGPVFKWKNLIVDEQLSSGASISFLPIGIKSNGENDTLTVLNMINNSADLSVINANIYPQIKLLINFKSSKGITSPSLNRFEINYEKLPELGINYQTIDFKIDSITTSTKAKFNFSVVNGGYSNADSVEVKVSQIGAQFNDIVLFDKKLDINTGEKKNISLSFTSGSRPTGLEGIKIEIDKTDKIFELYNDNNFAFLNYVVTADSSKPQMDITFDGRQIIDEDFVSSNPDIKIELNSDSPSSIIDTSVLKISLNNKPVYFSDNSGILDFSINANNPKVIVNYKPALKQGHYNLKVTGRGNSTKFANSIVLEKNFAVSNTLQLLKLYNFPNPFSSSTYFTFKLTQIPEKLKIKIFTVAGRLVRVIKIKSAELNYDFNRIFWDGRDQDGNLLANGVYLYKIITSKSGKVKTQTQKLAIVR